MTCLAPHNAGYRFALWLLVVMLTCSLSTAWARPNNQAADASPVASGGSDHAPATPSLLAASLQTFMPQPDPIMLRGASSEDSVSLPISPRLNIRRATLHLIASNSVSLLASRSQLQVRLNGQIIAQIALNPKLPQIQAQIDLPLRLLLPGYNALTFAVAQHYTNECEDPSAPELWTQIDTARSWIALTGQLRDIGPTLAKLPEVFDPKLWGPQRLTVIAPGGLNADTLRWGALASQAVALRLGYAPLQVRFAAAGSPADGAAAHVLRLNPSLVPSGDAVFMGTATQLRPYLSDALVQSITGPFLGIVPLCADCARYVLIASGQTPQQVDLALRAANVLSYPYPDIAATVVRDIELPRLPDAPGARMVYPNQKVTFASLGMRTTSFSGMYGQQVLQFTLPPDLFAPDNSMVHFKLRFAYGAGLREDSVLNMFLNDKFQAAIALNAKDGGYFRDYEVTIPLTSFKPGNNELSFRAAMVPQVTGRCVALNLENLRLTLFADSTLELPNAARVASLPDLHLLQSTGFPYTRKPYGADTVFVVTRADGANAAAAWMLAAKLAQVQKLPLLEARWQIDTANLTDQANAVVVGPAEQLPKSVTDALPLRLGSVSVAPYPVEAAAAGPGELGMLHRLWRSLASKFNTSAVPTQSITAWTTQQGVGLGKQGGLMQAALPGRAHGTLTVLTAAGANELLAQTDALMQPAVWSQLRGDLVLWQGTTQITAQSVGPSYSVGEAKLSSRLGFLLSMYPWFWGLVIGVLGLLLALVTLRLLMRFLYRRHSNLPSTPDD